MIRMYNLTNLTLAMNFGDVVVYANSVSSGYLFGMFSIGLFFIILMAFRRAPFAESLLTASFLSFVLAAIAGYAGLLNVIFALAYLILLALTGLYVWVVNR